MALAYEQDFLAIPEVGAKVSVWRNTYSAKEYGSTGDSAPIKTERFIGSLISAPEADGDFFSIAPIEDKGPTRIFRLGMDEPKDTCKPGMEGISISRTPRPAVYIVETLLEKL